MVVRDLYFGGDFGFGVSDFDIKLFSMADDVDVFVGGDVVGDFVRWVSFGYFMV